MDCRALVVILIVAAFFLGFQIASRQTQVGRFVPFGDRPTIVNTTTGRVWRARSHQPEARSQSGGTWGNSNLNARQVRELTTLTAKDFARIRTEYKEWQKRLTIIPNYLLVILMMGCALSYYFIPSGWVRVPAVIIGISCFMTLCRREGHAEGYVEGYDEGHADGIHKVLGIKSEELKEMHEFATDMEIDEMLVKRMNERQANQKD